MASKIKVKFQDRTIKHVVGCNFRSSEIRDYFIGEESKALNTWTVSIITIENDFTFPKGFYDRGRLVIEIDGKLICDGDFRPLRWAGHLPQNKQIIFEMCDELESWRP